MRYLFIFLCLASLLSAQDPSAGFSVPTPITTRATTKIPASIVAPIDAQLRNLRSGDIEHAYKDTTSSEFQASTSLEAFKEFVEKYPILLKHKTLEVKPVAIQQNDASVTVVLNPLKEAVTVNYLLVKEHNLWKIWHVSVTPLYSEEILALLHNEQALRKPIEDQLKALKNDNSAKAYQEYTSESFRSSTSLDAFRKFLKEFPIFTHYLDYRFKDPVVEKGTGRVEVDLHTETSITTVEYTLGIEDDMWKIWGIQILKQFAKEASSQEFQEDNFQEVLPKAKVMQTKQPEPKELSLGPMDFSRIEIGDKIDSDGGITNPSVILRSNQGDIYVNLFVRNGIFGTKVNLAVEHLDTHSSIPAIATTLQQDGNVEVSFVLSSPSTGWPRGQYLLTATSSTGAKRTLRFTVE